MEKPIITDLGALGARMLWEYGEHTGTITFPGDDSGPVDVQWDGDAPDNWEDIEVEVENAANEALASTPTPNTERSRLVDNFVTPPRPILVEGVEVVPIYVSRKEEAAKKRLLFLLRYVEGRIQDAVRRIDAAQFKGAVEDLKQLEQEVHVRIHSRD